MFIYRVRGYAPIIISLTITVSTLIFEAIIKKLVKFTRCDTKDKESFKIITWNFIVNFLNLAVVPFLVQQSVDIDVNWYSLIG